MSLFERKKKVNPVEDLDLQALYKLQDLGKQILTEVSTNPVYAAKLLLRLHQEQDSLSQPVNIYKDLIKEIFNPSSASTDNTNWKYVEKVLLYIASLKFTDDQKAVFEDLIEHQKQEFTDCQIDFVLITDIISTLETAPDALIILFQISPLSFHNLHLQFNQAKSSKMQNDILNAACLKIQQDTGKNLAGTLVQFKYELSTLSMQSFMSSTKFQAFENQFLPNTDDASGVDVSIVGESGAQDVC